MNNTKCLIIGSGPAGYTAAIYASRANLSPLLYTGLQVGGQLIQTTKVENFPGFPTGVDANQLMMDMRQQAENFGAEIKDGVIANVDFSARPYKVWTDDGTEVRADTIIIATGASAKYLGLADEERFRGMGVSACATCDGFFYRKKTVAVVGGGDTACEDALYLSGLAKKVYLVVRKSFLRASKVMQERVMQAENIEILFNHVTLGLTGDEKLGVQGIKLVSNQGEANEEKKEIAIDGLFLAIGHNPNTELFRNYLETDEQGYFKTIGDTPRTKLPGIYAAGDCMDPTYRQAIVAAGSGCKAALEAERFLMKE